MELNPSKSIYIQLQEKSSIMKSNEEKTSNQFQGKKNIKNPQSIIWVENLCIGSFFYLIPHLLRGCCIEVRYFYFSPFTKKFLKFLKWTRITNKNWILVKFSFSEMYTKNNCCFYHELLETISENCGRILDQIYEHSPLSHVLENRFRRRKIRLFVQKTLFQKIDAPMRFASILSWYKLNDPFLSKHSHILFLSRRGTNNLLQPYLNGLGLRLVEYRSLSSSHNLVDIVKGIFGPLILFFKLIRSKTQKKIKASLPLMAVQAVGRLDFQKQTHLFWYPYSEINPVQILVYFDRPDYQSTQETTEEIEKHGMQWMDLSKWRPTALHWWRSFQTCFRVIYLIGNTLFRQRPARWWQLAMLTNLMRYVDFHESFYKKFNIRIVLPRTETDPVAVARVIAMDLVGGIYVGYHYSHFPISAHSHSRPHHVFFTWGPHYLPIFENDGSDPDAFIITGHIHSHLNELSKTSSDRKQRLLSAGAKYILAIFDTSYSDNNTEVSRNTIVKFYKAFLEELLRDNQIGLIIKPKLSDTQKQLSEISELFHRATDTGRCILLDSKITATEAAISADMAVGLGINSAAIEAALTGTPAIHADLSNYWTYSFYEWGNKKVIFNNLNQIIEILRKHRKDPQHYKFLGDHSPILSEIDSFQDGKAAQRLGSYLRWFLEHIAITSDQKASFEYANNCYSTNFGIKNIRIINQKMLAPQTLRFSENLIPK